MAEAFELFDEPSAVAFGVLGVAAAEEFLAEFVVGDALLEDVVGGGEDFVGGRQLWGCHANARGRPHIPPLTLKYRVP